GAPASRTATRRLQCGLSSTQRATLLSAVRTGSTSRTCLTAPGPPRDVASMPELRPVLNSPKGPIHFETYEYLLIPGHDRTGMSFSAYRSSSAGSSSPAGSHSRSCPYRGTHSWREFASSNTNRHLDSIRLPRLPSAHQPPGESNLCP